MKKNLLLYQTVIHDQPYTGIRRTSYLLLNEGRLEEVAGWAGVGWGGVGQGGAG